MTPQPVSFGGLTSPKVTPLLLQGAQDAAVDGRGARMLSPFLSWLIPEVTGQSPKGSGWVSPGVLGSPGLGTSIGS